MPRTLLLAAICLLLAASPAFAHRVNIFAFVDGDAVQVECSFSRSQKVRFGEVTASDAVTGEVVFSGKTDDKGIMRFSPPQSLLRSGHDMLLSLNAGEGHKNTWSVSAKELAALTPGIGPESGGAGAAPAALAPATGGASAANSPGEAHNAGMQAGGAGFGAGVPVDLRELEALVGRVMDAKLVPVKEALGEMRSQGPGMKDIIGGLGWIFGLLGIAAYMKYKKPGNTG